MTINKIPAPPQGDVTNSLWKNWFTSMHLWVRQEGQFTPNFVGLTVGGVGGAVTHYGWYYKIGNIVFLNGLIFPTVATTTLASTAGNTYINNLPYAVSLTKRGSAAFQSFSGTCVNDSDGALLGAVRILSTGDSLKLHLYFPTFTTIANQRVSYTIWYQTDA